ncbi:FG-GAP repeat protein [Ponticoccus sp. SC2-23]|uniref:integrin alpha n=1 Tax=Alexandriicola marinus TaxID=2081710 RepID=UPI000FD7EDD0|nr:integrin alpha [Alexandriicola marinus]MBM1218566.1 FG-GAP repeat protein [Ponticoccus sp. SC6-9]MBM1224362.1 FG-GAP repeat protein [Ponticoccus sp. SC6-15]MBM1229858.1 FG-GAP repeat protein [Ponticoccus sp. SC6-38]MBM1233328.1 FG-GAP repeat protein [Ponticoccus sp. SC6-45]MBM1236722.1 FG-GAP repeat protein [Ponticoccus sp. SC6-49]MBM1242339.1 FG-GAP repeat protein [Ponticoccus sp. SC2-64]MBM1246852.1 FG-GAP repeat protein [Ponticoccus sp. SC6-42]MBM1251330.1 FG-GAP repeat protein [Ponti
MIRHFDTGLGDALQFATGGPWRKWDVVNGGDGDDVLEPPAWSGGAWINGGDGDDRITGSFARDRINAGDGDDIIEGSAGNDRIRGNDGWDTAVYEGSIFDFLILDGCGNGIVVDDLNVADGDEGTDRLKHIEVLQFGDYTFNLGGANAALVRVADQTGTEDVPHDFSVDAFDFDGGTVSVESVSVTGGGRMSVAGSSQVSEGQYDGMAFALHFDPSGQYDHLAFGESIVETVTVNVSDGQGNLATETLSLTIEGQNDAVMIDTGASTLSDGAVEDAAETLTGGGAILFGDADLGNVQTVSATLVEVVGDDGGLSAAAIAGFLGTVITAGETQAGGSVTWSFAADNTLFDYLDEGETVSFVYDLTIDDGAGGAATESVSFTVTGTADVSSTLNGFVLVGSQSLGEFGYAVAAAGDVNGDGIDDIIIGARSNTAGDLSLAGQAFVIYGSNSRDAGVIDVASLDSADGFVVDGIDAGGFAGASVASAGDIDGDGIDDLVIGAFGADTERGNSGEVYVIFGQDAAADGGFGASFDLNDLDGSNGFVLNGIDTNDNAGISVSSAGDINNDGIDDLLIGAYRGDPGGRVDAGETFVVFGSDDGFPAAIDLETLDGSTGFVIGGNDPSDQSGYSVSAAGDVNGDGIDDLLIGAPFGDTGASSTGEAYIVYGRDTEVSGDFGAALDLSALDGTNGFALVFGEASAFAGFSVAAAGDINNDGIGDIIIGSYGANPDGVNDAGQSFVVFGRDAATDGDFPASVDLGDLDGTDGFVLNGIDADDRSGFSVASAGDVNGDGIDDLLIGAPQGDAGGGSSGETYLIFGRDTDSDGDFAATVDLDALDGATGFVFAGPASGAFSGHAVSAAGDVNGDGIDDLIIGAVRGSAEGDTSAPGTAYVVYGGADLLADYDAFDGAADGMIQLELLGQDVFAM